MACTDASMRSGTRVARPASLGEHASVREQEPSNAEWLTSGLIDENG
jgi:hypothetical protein